jgi:hypothetical protein
MQDDQKKVLISPGHTGVQRLTSPTVKSIEHGSTTLFHSQDASTNSCGNRAPDLQCGWQEFIRYSGLLERVSCHTCCGMHSPQSYPAGNICRLLRLCVRLDRGVQLSSWVRSHESGNPAQGSCRAAHPGPDLCAFSRMRADAGCRRRHLGGGIWGTDMPRSYTCDFEVYDRRFTDKKNPRADIYVAIRDS